MKFGTVFNKILPETTVKVMHFTTGHILINEMTQADAKKFYNWKWQDLKNYKVHQFRIDEGVLIIEVI